MRAWAQEYGSETILCSSYTRAAAAEIAGRSLPLRRNQIGTLHGFAFRALGITREDVAESHLDEFNELHPGRKLSSGEDVRDEWAMDRPGATQSDSEMQRIEILRAQRIPEEQWPTHLRGLYETWNGWCREGGLIDFTGMLEGALENCPTAPGNPAIGLFDEVQDSTPLDLALIRSWGSHMDRILLAGDDDQAIYAWRGATPEAFLDPPVDDDHKRVLHHSYRVPLNVHKVAQAWVTRLTRREPKASEPRVDDNGEVVQGVVRVLDGGNSRFPQTIVEDAWKQVDAGRTVMVLASCAYLLEPLKRELREQAVPFHNPYRVTRGDWNPLRGGTANRRTATDRLLAYLRPQAAVWGDEARMWTWADVVDWMEPMRVRGLMRTGVKARFANAPLSEEAPYWTLVDDIYDLEDDDILRVDGGDLAFFKEHLLAARAKAFDFPLAVAAKRGAALLREKPRLVIGTIHSTKGAEADCSPPDEPVLTHNRGWVPIAELDPVRDRLISFEAAHHKIYRGGPRRQGGYEFTMGSRSYEGRMLTVKTENSVTRVTPNHVLLVRWQADALRRHVVYLMRRGNWWRVGITTIGGLGGRVSHELADEAWALSVHATRHEALIAEQIISHTYRVPDLTFEAHVRNSNQLSSMDLHGIWNRIESEPQAKDLLDAFGRDERWPLWSERPIGKLQRRRQGGARNRWEIRAANLLADVMEIPTDPGVGQLPLWCPVSEIAEEPYAGQVFSLNVEPWHYYISGNAIVHNCVYLMPELSRAGGEEWGAGGTRKDGIVRQFYVGITRAREELVFCTPSSPRAIEPAMWMRALR